MSELTAWDRLAAVLTDDPGVAAPVRLALTDPAAYLAEHRLPLLDRGIERPEDIEGVLALVDELVARDECAYVDWREPPDQVRVALAALPRVRAAGISLAGVPDGDPERMATAANALLAPAGVVVVAVSEGSDAYPLVALPADLVPAAVAAGEAVDVWVQDLR